MKLYTPEIAWHNQEPVLSLDIKKIDTNLYKAVTSGSDRHLVVWKVTLAQPDLPSGSTITKQISIEPLADLSRHPKAINCVKFSSNAKLFASGDDEGNIFIWKLKDKSGEPMAVDDADPNDRMMGSGTSFEDADGVTNEEDWGLYRTLRGHNEDVVDLCWSPNGQFLLSGSVDNDAVVWDVIKGVRINYLAGHKGYVQGVAWDPIDNYIVTLSTDRSLRVFNTTHKRLLYKVYKSTVKMDDDKVKTTRLFYDDTLPTYSRRICFSPGGELLLAPSGVIELDPDEENFKFINAVHIFTRNCINKPRYYLSTENLYNTAIRCCPQRFELKPELTNPFPFPYRIIFAVATQESVLLYDTQQTEPFASISNIHYTRLTDISWSDDGRLLMISSTDGYCSFVIFEEAELGIPYNGEFYKYETAAQNSCASSPAKEGQDTQPATPESASKHKKTPEVTKITNFFRKLDKSEAKTPTARSPLQPVGSIKRKEIIVDLSNEESPLKKFHCSSSESSKKEFKEETKEEEKDEVKEKAPSTTQSPVSVTPKGPRRLPFLTLSAKKE